MLRPPPNLFALKPGMTPPDVFMIIPDLPLLSDLRIDPTKNGHAIYG